MREVRNAYKILVRGPDKGRDNSDDIGVDGMVSLKCVSEK
jgi:hypothetical protein